MVLPLLQFVSDDTAVEGLAALCGWMEMLFIVFVSLYGILCSCHVCLLLKPPADLSAAFQTIFLMLLRVPPPPRPAIPFSSDGRLQVLAGYLMFATGEIV